MLQNRRLRGGLLALAALAAVAIAVGGCDKVEPTTLGPNDDQSVVVVPMASAVKTYNLWAGQNLLVGHVEVWNSVDSLYVKYVLTEPNWYLAETHVHVGHTLAEIPQKNGNPIPGQFDYKRTYPPHTTTEDTYQIYWQAAVGDSVYIAAHAAVEKWVVSDTGWTRLQGETAWGGDNPFPGKNWALYIGYIWQEQLPPPPPPDTLSEETMWARMNNNPDDFTYPFEGGNWSTYLITTPTTTPTDFYLYAGQWYYVGLLQVWKDAANLYVKYDLASGYTMDLTHLAVETSLNDIPQSGGGAIPGLFEYSHSYDPKTDEDTYTIPWEAAWNGVPLYIAAHGQVWGVF